MIKDYKVLKESMLSTTSKLYRIECKEGIYSIIVSYKKTGNAYNILGNGININICVNGEISSYLNTVGINAEIFDILYDLFKLDLKDNIINLQKQEITYQFRNLRGYKNVKALAKLKKVIYGEEEPFYVDLSNDYNEQSYLYKVSMSNIQFFAEHYKETVFQDLLKENVDMLI